MKKKLPIAAVVGALSGIVVGILTAPKSGKESRGDIKRNVHSIKHKASGSVARVTKKANNIIGYIASKLKK